jgi:cytochrome P450
LVTTAESGEGLTNDELFATFVLFLIAGHENLTSLLSNGLIALLENTAQLKLLQQGTVTWENGVHELMRYVTPNQFIRRTALANIELRERSIQKGEVVVLVLAAANRDPEQFTDPNSLNVARPHRWTLALGHGIHYCLGAPLAQLESEITFSRLFSRFPQIRRASDTLEYENNFNVRLLKSLPVALA